MSTAPAGPETHTTAVHAVPSGDVVCVTECEARRTYIGQTWKCPIHKYLFPSIMYGNTHILVTEQMLPGGKYGDTCGGSDSTSETPSWTSLIARPRYARCVLWTQTRRCTEPLAKHSSCWGCGRIWHSIITRRRIVLRDIAVDRLQTTNGISRIVS